MNIRKQLYCNSINIVGIEPKKKVIAIESDDWGSIRIPSKKVYQSLLKSSINVENCPYSRFDSLETEEDLNELFNVLIDIKDKKNNHPIITANFLTSNPDFDLIRGSNFEKYFFEPITVTYSNHKSRNVLQKIRDGIENQLFTPQFHGREHLNVNMWLDLIKTNAAIKKAFDLDMFALSFANSEKIVLPYLASFMRYRDGDDENFNKIIDCGIEQFKTIFELSPSSFIAPVYVWSDQIEKHLKLHKFKSIQGLPFQKKYYSYNSPPKNTFRFLKKQTGDGLINLTRNCFFEPSTRKNYDWINVCLKDISTAFFWGRPAIICSHRLNFIGGLNKKNRENNLKDLKILLKTIIKKWPDVEFVSSAELVDSLH